MELAPSPRGKCAGIPVRTCHVVIAAAGHNIRYDRRSYIPRSGSKSHHNRVLSWNHPPRPTLANRTARNRARSAAAGHMALLALPNRALCQLLARAGRYRTSIFAHSIPCRATKAEIQTGRSDTRRGLRS